MIIVVSVLTISAFAASATSSQAVAAATATGMSADEVAAIRTETDKTYGDIAKDAGNYEEFKAISTQRKLDIIDARVEEGTLTPETAEELKAMLQECDGTSEGDARLGQKYSVGFGRSETAGQGQGNGNRSGNGQRTGSRAGNGN